jgi:LysR family transcriptional regulator, hydrogen peroxide-inducible genes activator
MPSLSQLEYIVAVEKHRHFGKAAGHCHVSQPTLSMQIQKAEEEIGFPIFDRIKKPVVPTAKGMKFIAQAKVLLHEHHKLMDISKSQSGAMSGELKLGVIPTLAPYLLPLFIESFSKDYPDIHLIIDELKTQTIVERLREDTLDAGLLATPLHEQGLRERPIFYEPFYLYVAKNHALNARKRIKEDDLKGDEMWLLQDGHCLRNQIARFCSLTGSEHTVFPSIQFEGGNIDTLRNIIRKAQGYTLVPRLFVETLSESEKRDYVREFEKPVPSREVSLVFRRDQWKQDLLKALQDTIAKRLPADLKLSDPKKQMVLAL